MVDIEVFDLQIAVNRKEKKMQILHKQKEAQLKVVCHKTI